MKQFALYIVLFSYSLLMVKPVMPYVYDAVAHVFFYAKHMATVHYEDGKFHVHKEIVDAKNSSTGNDSTSPNQKKQNTTTEHIITAQRLQGFFINRATAYPIPVSSSLMLGNIIKDFPPPRV